MLRVDSVDVTSSATVTATGVSYTPATAQADGTHTIELTLEDTLGNSRVVTWTYTVATGGQSSSLAQFWWLIVVIIVVVIVMAIFTLRKKKPQPAAMPPPPETPVPPPPQP